MGTKHTPTPWGLSIHEHTGGIARGHKSAWVRGPAGHIEVSVEDGEFIVHACNSHDQLVSALTACLKRLVADCADKSCVEIMEARAALTAAGVA